MSERVVCRLGDGWRLAADPLQWILQRRTVAKGIEKWRSVSFVATTKDVLLRVCRENGVAIDPEGWTAFNALPNRPNGPHRAKSAVLSGGKGKPGRGGAQKRQKQRKKTLRVIDRCFGIGGTR